jgi:hypothetical protein
LHAVIDPFETMGVIVAPAGLAVQETTTDVGIEGSRRPLLFLQLIKAAFAAAVAKAIPF